MADDDNNATTPTTPVFNNGNVSSSMSYLPAPTDDDGGGNGINVVVGGGGGDNHDNDEAAAGVIIVLGGGGVVDGGDHGNIIDGSSGVEGESSRGNMTNDNGNDNEGGNPSTSSSYTQMYQCDKCHTAVFSTMALAMEHEATCRGVVSVTVLTTGDGGNDVKITEEGKEVKEQQIQQAQSAAAVATTSTEQEKEGGEASPPKMTIAPSLQQQQQQQQEQQQQSCSVPNPLLLAGGNNATANSSTDASNTACTGNSSASSGQQEKSVGQRVTSSATATAKLTPAEKTVVPPVTVIPRTNLMMTVFNEDSARDIFSRSNKDKGEKKETSETLEPSQQEQKHQDSEQKMEVDQTTGQEQTKMQVEQSSKEGELVQKEEQQFQQQSTAKADSQQTTTKPTAAKDITKEPSAAAVKQQQEANETKEKDTITGLSKEEMKVWADSLVGKWWEVFWEPESTNNSGVDAKTKLPKSPKMADKKRGDRKSTAVVDLTSQSSGIVLSSSNGQGAPVASNATATNTAAGVAAMASSQSVAQKNPNNNIQAQLNNLMGGQHPPQAWPQSQQPQQQQQQQQLTQQGMQMQQQQQQQQQWQMQQSMQNLMQPLSYNPTTMAAVQQGLMYDPRLQGQQQLLMEQQRQQQQQQQILVERQRQQQLLMQQQQQQQQQILVEQQRQQQLLMQQQQKMLLEQQRQQSLLQQPQQAQVTHLVQPKQPPSKPKVAQQPQPQPQPTPKPQPQPQPTHKRILQRFNLTYSTPSLGLSLILTSNSFISIKDISPHAPNSTLLKVNDRVVGVNDKRFEELGCRIIGRDTFHRAITILKSVPRPMRVMFERVVSVPVNTNLGVVQQQSQQQRQKQGQQLASGNVALSGNAATNNLTMGQSGLQQQIPKTATPLAMVSRAAGAESDEDMDNIPLNKLQHQVKKKRYRKKKEQLSDSSSGSENDEENEDSDADAEEDDIDWYDAKILSYNETSQQFTVHFLGDEVDVTYTMKLVPSVVRPSVRAWTKRTLGLLCCLGNSGGVGDLLLSSDNSYSSDIVSMLSASTDLPEDSEKVKAILNTVVVDSTTKSSDNGDVSGGGGFNKKRLMEYKMLLVLQQYLATKLSPHDDDDHDEEDSDDDEGAGSNGPGPLADSVYVKHLCDCMKEAERACDWLMSESAVLDMVCKIVPKEELSATLLKDMKQEQQKMTVTTVNKVSKEALLSFLVNGARFLNHLLPLDPSQKNGNAASAKLSRKGRRGRKKRRLSGASSESDRHNNGVRAIDDAAFDNMLSKALTSNESLRAMLTPLLKKAAAAPTSTTITATTSLHTRSSSKQQSSSVSVMSSTLTRILTTLFEDVWMTFAEWSKKSNDMIHGMSKQFYSVGEVEEQLFQASSQKMNLALLQMSEETDPLDAKLSRARSFEMEAWNAIRACTQPVVAGTALAPTSAESKLGDNEQDDDDCMLALQKLKDEALTGGSMHNLNPLGRHTVDSSTGLTMPSSLTRGVINDAIVVRRWILDLNQAKVVRERTSFVQDIIQRYVTLPQLPTPPSSNGLDGTVIANPSAVLAANTKDTITILSSNCYSYNHIIGNATSRLLSSQNGNTPADIFLRSKEGVSSMLAELVRVPILSVVEEKLHVRDELIDWTLEAQQLMKMAATAPKFPGGGSLKSKQQIPFSQFEALNSKLSAILSLSSPGRKKVCQKLKSDPFIDDQVKAFAEADERVVCAAAGTWVRDQFKRGTEWLAQYREVIRLLNVHGYSFGQGGTLAASASATLKAGRKEGLVQVTKISVLLEEHMNLAASFPEEYGKLKSVSQSIEQWADAINQAVSLGSLTLQERCLRLTNASNCRPKGIAVEPAANIINLWIRAFSWRLELQQGVNRMLDHFLSWQRSHPTAQSSRMEGNDYQEMNRLLSSVLAPLITEGQDFLIPMDNLRPFLADLRLDALRSIQTPGRSPLKKMEILNSGNHGMSVLDRILDMEADKASGSCSLLFARRVFWMMIMQGFFARLEKPDFGGDLLDAKALLALCPQGLDDNAASSFMDTRAEEARLQKIIDHATNLENKSSAVLERCNTLLQVNCYSHKEELRTCLISLSDIQTNLCSEGSILAVKLLRDKTIQKKLDWKIKGLTWLLGTFAYDLFHQSHGTQQPAAAAVPGSDRIHINNLKDLQATIPVTIGPQGKVIGDSLDNEIARISLMVKDLWDHANEWQTKVTSLIPDISKNESGDSFGDEDIDEIVELEQLVALSENPILAKVIIPETGPIQNLTATALQVQSRVKNELFRDEYHGTDVIKARLPDGTSLVDPDNGDFVLYRFTGGQMYEALSKTLNSIKETATKLHLRTPEKATLEWMMNILNWVDSIRQNVGCGGHYEKDQLVIKIENALGILERGHETFYTISDEVQNYLRREKVGLQVFPEKFDVTAMKGCPHTLGLGLLRWAALLFECLSSDVDEEDRWKVRVLETASAFLAFESGSIGGTVSFFKDATRFKENVDSLITEASDLIVQDDELLCSLDSIPEKMEKNALFQKSLEAEQNAMEERAFLLDKQKFENPQRIVNDRFELLGSLLDRLPPADVSEKELLGKLDDSSLLFAGDPSVRDKSRFFLEKSLWTGMETLGLDPNEGDTQDFCSVFAWNLEDAVYEKYHNDPSAQISKEYRDKIRSLRFNLQDPKNPMLCARVIAGNFSIQELISASTEDLASNELKLRRRQVEEEAIKNVVLSADSAKKKLPPPAAGITSDLAAKIRVDSMAMNSRSPSSLDVSPTFAQRSEENYIQDDGALKPSPTSPKSPSLEDISHSPAAPLSSPAVQRLLEETNQILASIPPPPMKDEKSEPIGSPIFELADDQYDSPPPSPLLSASESYPPSDARPRSHHISSQSGTDLFQITISKLKLSFTTKIAADQSCTFDIDRFLPSILVEKGRLSLDQFNKFMYDKAKSGRWNIAFAKLSSITGDANMSCYKKFYKEYESVGRLTMIQVSDTTKLFLVTPKFLRVCKCLSDVENLSRSSTYVIILTKEHLPLKKY